MWNILSTIFVVVWSVANAVNMTMPKENFACMEDQTFKECIQMLNESMSKQNQSTSSSMSVSVQVNSPADVEQLCQNFAKTNACFQRNGIRTRCPKNIAIKALDNVVGFVCAPANKKVAMEKLPCFQNLTKTDPRIQQCVSRSADPCEDMLSKIRCLKPVIVEGCGNEIFKFAAELSANALKIVNINCDISGVSNRMRRTATNQNRPSNGLQSFGNVLKRTFGENNGLMTIMNEMLL